MFYAFDMFVMFSWVMTTDCIHLYYYTHYNYAYVRTRRSVHILQPSDKGNVCVSGHSYFHCQFKEISIVLLFMLTQQTKPLLSVNKNNNKTPEKTPTQQQTVCK